MSSDDLNEDEIIELYEYIVDRVPAYAEVKEELSEEVCEETDEGDDYRTRIEQGIREARSHDNLLGSTISVFLPNSRVHRETGWQFLGAEPLCELNVRNADAIIGNPDRNIAVLIECKASVSRPGKALEQLYDAADAVREYEGELSENIGMEIEELECVICVPSTHDIRVARELESYEQDGSARERVFIWRLHYHQNGEQLDIFDRIDTRDPGEETHNNQLAQVLRGGIDITLNEQATPSFYPSSHLFRIMEEVFSNILTKRTVEDGPIRHFGGAEVLEIMTDQRHLPHYDADQIGARIFDELMDRLLEFDLITGIGAEDTELGGEGDFYRYKVTGRSRSTLISNLSDAYKDAAVEWEIELEAMRRTIDQFDDDQGRLSEF